MNTPVKKRLRCAVYTRKSTEEGLDQEYNSIDAQRDAGHAYITSQRAEGWIPVSDDYDDPAYSGGNMERPGLKRLMADIENRRVDVVVVYKVDRLSRSLSDFARMVDLFDQHGVSFVSVTQQFNTTTSMGQLTLNILLSFAQFEREVMTALGIHLDQAIPRKIPGGNLLIATWNLRAFASLTREWTAGAKDSPKRDLRGLLAIGEIMRRFDVIAIQEVKGDLRALRDLLRWLGDGWAFLMTDVTLGSAGNDERMAFLFDTTRLKPSGLACELVVPPEWLDEIAPDALRRQFVRTPYAVSFRAADTTFILVTLHVTFGDSAIERIPELKGIARWMREWANKTNDWSQNLIALGDFNIDRQGDPLWQAFVSTGLAAPEALNKVPRTVFSDPGKPETNKFYDQIAWFQSAAGIPKLTMNFCAAGHVDFLPYVYTDMGLSKQSVSYRVSDHFPLWAEFALG